MPRFHSAHRVVAALAFLHLSVAATCPMVPLGLDSAQYMNWLLA